MNTDEIKQDFINYMEKKHVGLLFPSNYFGCLFAVFIEQEPVTQDRIQQLTNYSRTTISQMLKILQVNFPLIQIKKPGIRKKFYTINVSTRSFMLTFLTMIIDAYRDKVDFFLPLIEELTPYTKRHPKFQKLRGFLEMYHENSNLYIKLLLSTADDFRDLIRTEHNHTSKFDNANLISSQERLEKIQILLNSPKVSSIISDEPIEDKSLHDVYLQFKEKFYQKFRENLTISGSQAIMARTIIGTELLLEQRPLTQEEIQKATKFQRSTISSTLKVLLDRKMIQPIKKSGDRKKYYLAVQSWDSRMIYRLKLNIYYAMEMKETIGNFFDQIPLKNLQEKSNSLIASLRDIHHSYLQLEQYYKLLEVKFLNIRLKDEK